MHPRAILTVPPAAAHRTYHLFPITYYIKKAQPMAAPFHDVSHALWK